VAFSARTNEGIVEMNNGRESHVESVAPNARKVSKEEFLELLRDLLKSVGADELTRGSVIYEWGEPGMYLMEVATEKGQRSSQDSISPNGQRVPKDELLVWLTDLVKLIEADDSMEGWLSFESAESTTPLLEARLRTGNSMGQGGVAILEKSSGAPGGQPADPPLGS
jgi:hypothetical protein